MIYLPAGIPVSQQLCCETYELKDWASVTACKRVLLLNLMPQKAETEWDIARTVQQAGVSVQIIPIKIKGLTYKHTPQEHMDNFYLDFEEVEPYVFDRLIITGAPLEQVDFEDVRYWKDLCRIMKWSRDSVQSTLYICWAVQAGLYYWFGIPKKLLNRKVFGIYRQYTACENDSLMKGLFPGFEMPNSRYFAYSSEDLMQYEDLQILAENPESGAGVMVTHDRKCVFIAGHLEYNSETLHHEYHRDLEKGLAIQKPECYYTEDGAVKYSWKSYAIFFYRNWLSEE